MEALDINSEAQQKPEAFKVLKTQEEWLLSVVADAMKVLYSLTDEEELVHAISNGKILASTEREKECAYLLAAFLREELSGNLIPPPSLKRLYQTIVKESTR